MINFLFFLGVVVIPFSGVQGLGFMGETQHEASVYIFMPMLVVALPLLIIKMSMGADDTVSFARLNKIALAILGVILFSLAVNFFGIMDAVYLGRHGFEKFVKSIMMVVYGIMLAYFVYTIPQEKIRPLIIVPVAISAAICCFYSFFEITAHYAGISWMIAEKISSYIHFAPGISERIRSVAFEPPAFATYAAFAWPWLYAGIKTSKGMQKALYGFLWGAITVLPLFAISRTGYLTIAAAFIELFLLNRIYLARKPTSKTLQKTLIWLSALVVFAVIATILIFFDSVKESVIYGNNISNLSRLASNVAAFSMMKEHPLTGFGFGQYGFHAAEYMPSWGFLSWEIQKWFSFGGMGSAWPPVFSVYARFGAELGLLGLISWIALWLGLALAILKKAQAWQERTGEIPEYAKILILCCLTVLWVGIPMDSLRAPMIWVTLGLSCRFLEDIKNKFHEVVEDQNVFPERKYKFLISKAKHEDIFVTRK